MRVMAPIRLKDIIAQPKKLVFAVKTVSRVRGSSEMYRTTPTITIDDGVGTIVTLVTSRIDLKCLS